MPQPTATITIHLRGGDELRLKDILKDLARSDPEPSIYSDRSESQIAKLLLTEAAKRAHAELYTDANTTNQINS